VGVTTANEDDPEACHDGHEIHGTVVRVNGGVFRISIHGTVPKGLNPNRWLSVTPRWPQLEEHGTRKIAVISLRLGLRGCCAEDCTALSTARIGSRPRSTDAEGDEAVRRRPSAQKICTYRLDNGAFIDGTPGTQ
jgi:hypothetical protein